MFFFLKYFFFYLFLYRANFISCINFIVVLIFFFDVNVILQQIINKNINVFTYVWFVYQFM